MNSQTIPYLEVRYIYILWEKEKSPTDARMWDMTYRQLVDTG
jgi:hypothetical protein